MDRERQDVMDEVDSWIHTLEQRDRARGTVDSLDAIHLRRAFVMLLRLIEDRAAPVMEEWEA